MAQFSIKQFDTRPVLESDLSADLTGYISVRFRMTKLDGTVVIDEAVTPQNIPAGIVRYQWQEAVGETPGDTDVPGIFRGQWRVTFSDGKIETFPNTEYSNHPPLWIEITSQYG